MKIKDIINIRINNIYSVQEYCSAAFSVNYIDIEMEKGITGLLKYFLRENNIEDEENISDSKIIFSPVDKKWKYESVGESEKSEQWDEMLKDCFVNKHLIGAVYETNEDFVEMSDKLFEDEKKLKLVSIYIYKTSKMMFDKFGYKLESCVMHNKQVSNGYYRPLHFHMIFSSVKNIDEEGFDDNKKRLELFFKGDEINE